MSKSANDNLFGITLTELVIILFFIMLLLAMANIEELNERIPDNEEDVVPASTILNYLDPEAEIPTDLVSSERLERIKEEIAKLQADKEDYEKMKQSAEGEGDGDCKEGGNWINSKCADYCWATESEESNRPYDLLLDIGVCKSHMVVQRSTWLEKAEVDFQIVDGAWAAADQQKMSQAELYDYLDIVKEPGYLKEPKQCFHVVRVIDLGAKSVDAWNKNLLYVQERVSTETLTSGASYERVKDTFATDACALPVAPKQKIFKAEACSQKYTVQEGDTWMIIADKYGVLPVSIKDANKADGFAALRVGQVLLVPSCNQPPETKLKSEQVTSSSVNRIKPQMNAGSFNNEFFGIRQCKNTRSDDLQLTFIIDLDAEGKATEVRYKGEAELLSSGNKKIENIARRALLNTRFTPESIEGIDLSSQYEQPLKFRKNICL
ncbi:LysM peptidoglycan-binding domain-containing protein [Gammaproteobacteria bacterium]|nr:LysM peptidoglycan-binding domain-containing protein [Gammaproteobacteria bacterium]